MIRIYLFILFMATSLLAKPIVFGVFAYRSESKMIEKYQPLADHLSKELQTPVILRILSQKELEEEVHLGKIDIVSTNPSHFVALREKGELTGAIATEVKFYNGALTPYLGGVIIVSSARHDIKNILDLKGKKISIPGKEFLGGYQAQAYELFGHGLVLPHDALLLEAKSHDGVVSDVVKGRADAGFVRSGILEEMIDEKILSSSDIFVLSEKHFDHFPLKVSTALYPEWAIACSANLDIKIVKKTAVALYNYSPTIKERNQIRGFTIPADYTSVDSLARILHLPPYENISDFNTNDVLKKYGNLVLALFLLAIVAGILVSWIYTVFANKIAFQKIYAQSVFDAAPTPIIVTSGKELVSANSAFLSFFNYENIKDFKNEHKCVCDYFEDGETDDFLLAQIGNLSWAEYIIANPHKKHKAKVTIGEKTTIFEVKLSIVENRQETLYIIVFADISFILLRSTTDELTGVANRLYFNAVLEHSFYIARRIRQPLSVVFVDIDYFKAVNDNYGHLVGDAVLKQVASILKSNIRKSDVVARWGGEEFIVILPNTALDKSVEIAESLRKNIKDENLDSVGSITCSFGVATLMENENTEEFLNRSDSLLYQAKELGRDRIESELIKK